MINAKCAGGIVINPNNEVALVSNKNKSWTFPKGHMAEEENTLFAARREVTEETGIIDLELIRELGSYERGTNYHEPELKNITLFLFKTKEAKIKPIDPDNPEARWIAKDKVPDMLTYIEDKEFFQSISELI